MKQPFVLYYAATIVFALLDYVVGVNVRIAFLDPWPLVRLVYYGLCFGCLLLMLWKPAWAVFTAAIESLAAVVALTVAMALRVMIVTDEMIETGTGFVTPEEIINYLISGSVAYFAWYRAAQALKSSKIL